jgi:membrane protein required for colicin V production
MQTLPTLLDVILLSIMLVSGLLALVRGFMREILSIAAWAAAALASLLAYQSKLLPMAQDALKNDTLAKIAVVLGVFLVTLIVVSIITSRISDMILDSRIGALDRTLGFLFGLGRGLLIVAVALIFYEFFVQEKQRGEAVTKAKSRVVLEHTGEWLMNVLPDDFGENILKKISKKTVDDEPVDAEPTPAGATPGYSKPDRDGMKKQIEKSVGR